MENDDGKNVDLYIPRKWYNIYSNTIVHGQIKV